MSVARAGIVGFVALAIGACSSSSTPAQALPPAGASATTGGDEPQEDAAPATGPFTESEVQDLFDTKCVRCHAKNNTLLNLASFSRTTIDVPTAGGRAECADSKYRVRIAPGDREASLLWHKVNGTHDCGDTMPPSGPRLTAEELERLGLFIDGLAK